MRALFVFLLLITPLHTVTAQDALEQARERLRKAQEPVVVVPEVIEPELPPVLPEPEPEPPAVPKAGIRFSKSTSAPISVRYLAVGDNCPACPAGKVNFLKSGGLATNIMDWKLANRNYGQQIRIIPSEFVVLTTPPEIVVATAEGMEPSAEAFLTVLAAYLEQTALDQHNKSTAPNVTPDNPLYGGWFEYDLNVPDSVPSILQKLMKDKQYKNDTLGLLLSWPGTQTIKLSTTSITIEPAIKASVRKFGITASASITEIRFTPDYKTVTVVTPEVLVPDLTINFK
jgi:hypothetical protein